MLPEEVTKFIGQATGTTTIHEVEKGAIARYAEAVGDLNPLYLDEEYAKKSKYGSIIAPPGFFGWVVRRPRDTSAPEVIAGARGPNLAAAGYPRVLDGGMEYDFIKPIRAGDTLTSSSIIKDIVEREGRTGKMAFLIREATYTNQDGEVVAKTRGTSIHR